MYYVTYLYKIYLTRSHNVKVLTHNDIVATFAIVVTSVIATSVLLLVQIFIVVVVPYCCHISNYCYIIVLYLHIFTIVATRFIDTTCVILGKNLIFALCGIVATWYVYTVSRNALLVHGILFPRVLLLPHVLLLALMLLLTLDTSCASYFFEI